MTVNEASLGGDKATDGRDGNLQIYIYIYIFFLFISDDIAMLFY